MESANNASPADGSRRPQQRVRPSAENPPVLGLQLGFHLYRLKKAIVYRAVPAGAVRFDEPTPPDVSLELTEFREHLAGLAVTTAKEVWRQRILSYVETLEDYVFSGDLDNEAHDRWLSINRHQADVATEEPWSGDHGLLKDFLAIRPDLQADELHARFDSAWQSWQASSRKSRKAVPGEPEFLYLQREIAGLAGQIQLKRAIADKVDVDAWFQYLTRVIGRPDKTFHEQLKTGRLLGECCWICWCPLPDQFYGYMPRLFGKLGQVGVEVPPWDELLAKCMSTQPRSPQDYLQGRNQPAAQRGHQEPTGNPLRQPLTYWTEFLAEWLENKYEIAINHSDSQFSSADLAHVRRVLKKMNDAGQEPTSKTVLAEAGINRQRTLKILRYLEECGEFHFQKATRKR
jgi:hypothetical protein